jgi:hypothetical protein
MSAGVSPVALLVAAIFWGWLWGPLGLILSTPMTVCILVLGRYVPQLEFFEILLGDEPALATSVSFYQRLLARDQDEATDLIEEQLQTQPLEQVFDQVVVPALVMTKRDREQGDLSEEDERYILKVTRDLVSDLGFFETLVAKPIPTPGTTPAPAKVHILGCPAADEYDEVALLMFRHLVEASGADVEVASVKMLSAEVMTKIEEEQPALILITALPPGGVAQTRYLSKRLRARFPDLRILVGRWGVGRDNVETVRNRLVSAGATQVGTSLTESRAQVLPLVQTLAHVHEATAPAVAAAGR